MMRRPRHRIYHQMADINIANLVDVVLVLLIIFMISAPLLQSGIEINLPKTTTAVPEQEAEGVILTIDKKGGIYINDVWTRLENLETELKKELKRENTNVVYLRGDSVIPYGVAISVIGRIKGMGIDAINLVTGHEEGRRSRNQGR